jgi:hypothetical protein
VVSSPTEQRCQVGVRNPVQDVLLVPRDHAGGNPEPDSEL